MHRIQSLARRFLIVTLILIGALCGVLAVLFHWCVETARDFLVGYALQREGIVRVALVIITPAAVFALIAIAIRKLAPRAVGANLARVRMAYNEEPSLLGWRSVLATFFATPLSLGAGAPLGPEGPITVITSGFSSAPSSTWNDPRELIGFALLGVLGGVVSGGAIAIIHRLRRAWASAMPSVPMRVALAGALIGAGGLIEPRALGVGYESVSFWLHGGGTPAATAIAFAVKVLLVVIALGAGVLGGSFAPSLFIGTALGAAVGLLVQSLFPAMGIDPKAYAIIGMGAFFAGLLRSPIAAVL